jgi:hypothetical protein
METNIKVLLKSLAGYAPNIRKKGIYEAPSTKTATKTTIENKEKNDVILERVLCFNF